MATELKGVWGGTLIHEDVLARMEPRMGPSEEFLFGQEEVGGLPLWIGYFNRKLDQISI
ncbi:MAG: hypothetical protein HQ491_10275 [Bacteroidetes bacterium]|nr:hypothetical protein [Bacteroidota bacterium]